MDTLTTTLNATWSRYCLTSICDESNMVVRVETHGQAIVHAFED